MKWYRKALVVFGFSSLAVANVFGQTAKPERIIIKPESLPKPEKPTTNFPRVAPAPADAKLQLPPGFQISVFAEGEFANPRWMIEGPNGDLFLSDARKNAVFLLRDANKDGKIDNATERFTLVEGLKRPFGMAIQNGRSLRHGN